MRTTAPFALMSEASCGRHTSFTSWPASASFAPSSEPYEAPSMRMFLDMPSPPTGYPLRIGARPREWSASASKSLLFPFDADAARARRARNVSSASGGERAGQQDAAIDLLDVGASAEGHREVELVADDLEAARDARLAHGTQAVEERSSDERALRAECHRPQHVLSRADAAIHPHLDARAHGIGDRGQRADRGGRAVELAAAVVGDDERVGAGVRREPRVLDVHDPLEDELAAPALLHPLDVGPRQARVELR